MSAAARCGRGEGGLIWDLGQVEHVRYWLLRASKSERAEEFAPKQSQMLAHVCAFAGIFVSRAPPGGASAVAAPWQMRAVASVQGARCTSVHARDADGPTDPGLQPPAPPRPARCSLHSCTEHPVSTMVFQ